MSLSENNLNNLNNEWEAFMISSNESDDDDEDFDDEDEDEDDEQLEEGKMPAQLKKAMMMKTKKGMPKKMK